MVCRCTRNRAVLKCSDTKWCAMASWLHWGGQQLRRRERMERGPGFYALLVQAAPVGGSQPRDVLFQPFNVAKQSRPHQNGDVLWLQTGQPTDTLAACRQANDAPQRRLAQKPARVDPKRMRSVRSTQVRRREHTTHKSPAPACTTGGRISHISAQRRSHCQPVKAAQHSRFRQAVCLACVIKQT